jgi:hypothetical protein
MAHEKRFIGEFLARRAKNPDTYVDPYDPGRESPIELNVPHPDLDVVATRPPADPVVIGDLPRTMAAGKQPSLPISPSRPPADPFIVADPPRTMIAARQPSLPITLVRPPADPVDIGEPPRTMPAGRQPSLPAVPTAPPADPIDVPPTPPARPAGPQPSLGVEPSDPPSAPTAIDDPARTRPAARQPSQAISSGPAPLPTAPVPELSKPIAIPFQEPPPGRYDGEARPLNVDMLRDKNSVGLTLEQIDKQLYTYLKHVGDGSSVSIQTDFGEGKAINPKGEPYAPAVGGPFGMPGGQSWNPILFAKNLVRLGVHLKLGLVTFGAIQIGLSLLNKTSPIGPRVSIWNPLVIANPPLIQNFVPGTINAMLGFTHEKAVNDGYDRHKAIAEGKHVEPFQITHYPPFLIPPQPVGQVTGPIGAVSEFLFPRLVGAKSQDDSLIDKGAAGGGLLDIGKPLIPFALKTRNTYTDETPLTDNSVVNVSDLVDEAINGSKKWLVDDPDLGPGRLRFPSVRKDSVGSGPNANLSKLFFNPQANRLSSFYPLEFRPVPDLAKDNGKPIIRSELEKSAFAHGIIPSKFDKDNDQGFIATGKGKLPSSVITDDAAYVPLSFTDLRPIGINYRTVYFRPMNLEVKEDFQPEWNKAHYFGRTDWVATYQSTGRTVTLAFQLHAFGPEDLEVIHNKLNWLISMVYPEYDSDMLFYSGPVVRLRIGDIIASSKGLGLPGIIESLSFDYNGALWELKQDWKVPRSIKVAMSFVVLHDVPVGRGGSGKFGGLGSVVDGKYTLPSVDPIGGAGNVKFPQIKSDNADGIRYFGRINKYEQVTESR